MFIYYKHNVPRASADTMTPDGLFPQCMYFVNNPYHPCNLTSPDQASNTRTTDSGSTVRHPHIFLGKHKVRNCRETFTPPKAPEAFLAFFPKRDPRANSSCRRDYMWVNGFSDDGYHATRLQRARDCTGNIPHYPVYIEGYFLPTSSVHG